MRILITGGAGYIGSVVTAQAMAAGHQVVVFDNISKGHRQALPGGARLVQGDILDRDALAAALAAGFDAVMHFAALALVGESFKAPERYYRINVAGSLNLLEVMLETGVPHLVFSSSAATYGEPESVPITEDFPTRPTNPYGSTKLAVDRMIGDFTGAHPLGAVSLRYFNVAGAGRGAGECHHPETHLVPNVLRAALGAEPSVQVFGNDYPTPDGTCIRDYVHVEDLGEAHLLALAAAELGRHRIYNLGNGEGYSVLQVIDAARKVTGAPIRIVDSPRRSGDPARLVASSRRISEELGWEAKHPAIETIVADAWGWMRAHPNGYE